jgi:hypothetical protein
MARSKGSPLFDAMSRQRQRSPDGTLPGWEGEAGQEPIPPVAVAHESESTDDAPPWLGETFVVAIRHQTALVVSTVVFLAVIGTGYVGWTIGVSQERQKLVAMDKHGDSMNNIRAKPVNTQLWVNVPDHRIFTSASVIPTANRPATAQSSSGDPRTHGHNYFILMSVRSTHSDEPTRAAKFLKANGVDAAVLPTKNRSVVLVVLQGFAPPLRPKQSQIDTLRNKLKVLGRRWKAELKGSTDWYDLYLDKH